MQPLFPLCFLSFPCLLRLAIVVSRGFETVKRSCRAPLTRLYPSVDVCKDATVHIRLYITRELNKFALHGSSVSSYDEP